MGCDFMRLAGAAMITPVECRQRAIECREMAERAPNLRVQSILIDMARTWQRLALEAEQFNQKNERLLQPIKRSFPSEPPRNESSVKNSQGIERLG
jgi:hypothetical protein